MQLRCPRAATPSGPWRSFALPVRRASSSQGAIAASKSAGCSRRGKRNAATSGPACPSSTSSTRRAPQSAAASATSRSQIAASPGRAG